MNTNSSSVYHKLLYPLLCIAVTVWLLYVGQGVLKPLAMASLLALLLIGPCRFFEKNGVHRGIASLMCMLLALVFFIVLFYVLSTSIISFKKDLPLMMERLSETTNELQAWAKEKFNISAREMRDFVKTSKEDALPNASNIIEGTVNTISNVIFLTVIIFIYTFLLLMYRSLILQFFIQLFNKKYKESIHSIAGNIRFAIKGYMGGLIIEMAVIAFLNFTAFSLLGVKYAFLLAVISAIFNIIPYLGIFVGCVFSALVTFTTDTSATVLGVVIALIIIHMIDTNILMPKIVGSKVKLNALAAIAGVIAISAIWGLAGTFLAMPMLAIMKVIFEEVNEWRPFALLMGDDTNITSASKPVITRITNKVRRRPRQS